MNRVAVVLLLMSVSLAVRAQDTTRLSLLFLGDVMQHDSQIAAARQEDGSYSYAECFQYVRPLLESVDLTIGNLEVTLAGRPYKGYPQFSAPDQLVIELKNAGVDVLVTANNHCVDRGRKGLERTIDVLDSLMLPHTGTFKDSTDRKSHYPLRIEKSGFVISLLNYTYGTNGIPVTAPNIVNRIDTVQIAADIEKAKQMNPDAIIVFFHWGTEYQPQPNAQQKKMTDFCFARGVKLVIGAHPHVLQPMEWRKEKDQLVVYSLGNFVSGQRDRYKNGGGTIRVELEKVKLDSTTSTTFIRDADYEFQYVYRNAKKKYFLMPVRNFENDTTIIRELTEQQQIKLFAKDSRDLYGKYNLNIAESSRSYGDSLHYRLATDSLITELQSLYEFYGFEKDSSNGNWLIGKFYDLETAEAAGEQLKSKGVESLRTVRFRNGRRDD